MGRKDNTQDIELDGKFPHETFWELPPRHDGDRAIRRGSFPDVDSEHGGKEYWCTSNTEWMVLINCLNAHMELADRGMENQGMCVKYSSVKLLNIVTRKKWHILVPMPNDEEEEERGNEQDDDEEEGRWSNQDGDEEEEICSQQDDDEGMRWEFHGMERYLDRKEEEGEQHVNEIKRSYHRI